MAADTRPYEIITLSPPELPEDEAQAAVQKALDDFCAEHGGSVSSAHSWGRRRLAYRIKKHDSAVYTVFGAELPPAVLAALEEALRIHPAVIRSLVTLRPGPEAPATPEEIDQWNEEHLPKQQQEESKNKPTPAKKGEGASPKPSKSPAAASPAAAAVAAAPDLPEDDAEDLDQEALSKALDDVLRDE